MGGRPAGGWGVGLLGVGCRPAGKRLACREEGVGLLEERVGLQGGGG